MTDTEYRRLTLAEMRGRRYRTTRPLNNSWGEIPAGTEVRVVNKFGGLTIEAERCSCCGLRARISRVHPAAVAEIAVERD